MQLLPQLQGQSRLSPCEALYNRVVPSTAHAQFSSVGSTSRNTLPANSSVVSTLAAAKPGFTCALEEIKEERRSCTALSSNHESPREYF